MQDLCAFAHAVEVSVRENQRIRWRIVHGGYKWNSVFFETCKLFVLCRKIACDSLEPFGRDKTIGEKRGKYGAII